MSPRSFDRPWPRRFLSAVTMLGLAGAAVSCGLGGGVSLPGDPASVQSCGDLRCDSAISYANQIVGVQRADVLGWTITLCHQAICASRGFAAILDSDQFDCSFTGLVQASCRLAPESAGASNYTLSVAFSGPGEDYRPGDRFAIRVDGAAATPAKLDFSATVSSYRDDRPNGDGCAPLCRVARLNEAHSASSVAATSSAR